MVTWAMVTLIGVVGLAVDLGYLYATKRHMQTAADAAAIAGATALRDGESYASAADDVTSLNGFTDGKNNVTVTVSEPALPSPYPSDVTYVEVEIAQSVPVYFLRVFGYNSMNVAARAVSGAVPGPACIYALDPTDSATIGVTGTFNIDASCGIMDDSTSSSGIDLTGTGTLKATSIGVTGSSFSKTGTITVSPNPVTKVAALPDPLASQAKSVAPSAGTCTQNSATKSGSDSLSGTASTLNVSPAIYSSGINISGTYGTITFAAGNYGNNINLAGTVSDLVFNPGQYQNGGSGDSIDLAGTTKVTFNSGSYTFCGKVKITGTNNVTLPPGNYFGGIDITGSATVTFQSGTYILAGGGLQVTGTSTLSGTGVTFYDTSASGYAYAPIDLTGTETANFSAPTSGPLEGFLFFQDPSVAVGSAAATVTGTSSSTFDGILYFPTTDLTYTGTSSSSGYTILIAYKMTFTGTQTMNIGSNYSSLADGAPIKASALYE